MKISLQGISFAYPDHDVLSSIDLEVESGEFVALLGPNGCGKTTLLKHAAGILQAHNGAVFLDLQELGALAPRELARRLAIVEQDRQVGFAFTASELVEFGRLPHLDRLGRPRKLDRQVVRQAMELTGVAQFADRPITQLSGGERQRVFLAMALAQQPQALLLDEPTAHLDIQHQLEFLQLVRDRGRDGLTVIMALHDVNMAAAFADRLAVMSEGKLVAVGPPREVLTPQVLEEAFGVHCVVGANPATGSAYVHFLTSSPPERRQGRVVVIGGGGAAAPLLATIARRHHATLAVVAPLDSDYEVAQLNGIPVITEAPFSPVSEESLRKLRAELVRADQVIVAPLWVGPGNLAVLETVRELAPARNVVVLDPEGVQGRDFTDGKATSILRGLLAAGAVPSSEQDLLRRKSQ